MPEVVSARTTAPLSASCHDWVKVPTSPAKLGPRVVTSWIVTLTVGADAVKLDPGVTVKPEAVAAGVAEPAALAVNCDVCDPADPAKVRDAGLQHPASTPIA